jgi:hypothetical protein
VVIVAIFGIKGAKKTLKKAAKGTISKKERKIKK